MKKYKVIIDTDPGVDDTTALVYFLNDPHFDIKLITTLSGNISIEKSTRNMCHLLDIFQKDIPVVTGRKKRFGKSTESAEFLHGQEGLGFYLPPQKTTHQPIDSDPADAVYEILKANPKEVTIVIIGPHTNFAHLLEKHPDAKDLVKRIVMEGAAPTGIMSNPNHSSFNIRTDAPAFQKTIDSGVEVVMIPSTIGRDQAFLTAEQVEKIKETNLIGKFLWLTFQSYWEPKYTDKRIACNDITAYFYITNPLLFKTKRAFIDLDQEKYVGKTTARWDRHGNFKVVQKINNKNFIKHLFKRLEKMGNIEISDETFLNNLTDSAIEKALANGLKKDEPKKTTKKATAKKTTEKTKTASTKKTATSKPKTTKTTQKKTTKKS